MAEDLVKKKRPKRKVAGCGFKGVYPHKSGMWRAVIRVDGVQKTVGYFHDMGEAIGARNIALENHGLPID